MKVHIVPHVHWDREWYRTFQEFRARLVDLVDGVLDRAAANPASRFQLDGQSIVVEDYLEVRPGRREELRAASARGQISVGPWYVQPDSLLPSGEAHVRNLREGHRIAATLGPVSRVAHTPDSFGHPAQFPQIFSGFGIVAFTHWRGSGDEADTLSSEYRWTAPDGSSVVALRLDEGYFAGTRGPHTIDAAVERLARAVERLRARAAGETVLLLAGSDHLPADPHVAELAAALARKLEAPVVVTTLDEMLPSLPTALSGFRGELSGARVAFLLSGVWSTRLPLKLRNRRCEMWLERWAEPAGALGTLLGVADERPSLGLAWRALLRNQAHDSIGGCSVDRVHEQMLARYDESEELARETTTRVLERIAGRTGERATPWTDEIEIAVFNPSPFRRSDRVRFSLDAFPVYAIGDERAIDLHPLVISTLGPRGFAIDGQPVRVVPADPSRGFGLLPTGEAWDLEWIAEDVPALGWKRFQLRRAEPSPEIEDDGREIECDDMRVAVNADGTLAVTCGERSWPALAAIEDMGDRGDTYDADVIDGAWELARVAVVRRRHASGMASLEVRRALRVPAALAPDRASRGAERTDVTVTMEVIVTPGVRRVDLRVTVDNGARDHRLRLLFATGKATATCRAATTFDIAVRSTVASEHVNWRQPPTKTFPHQGWVRANDLTVVAPGLPEAEVRPDGVIALTLLRSVGWLSRPDLASRPGPAGPSTSTPGAQCLGAQAINARLALLLHDDPTEAAAAEASLLAILAGPAPLVPPGIDLLSIEPRDVLLSAFLPSETAGMVVLRLSNPTDRPLDARIRFGFEVASAEVVRLDEAPTDEKVALRDRTLTLPLPPHALRSVRLGVH